jgi:hypothetical protein
MHPRNNADDMSPLNWSPAPLLRGPMILFPWFTVCPRADLEVLFTIIIHHSFIFGQFTEILVALMFCHNAKNSNSNGANCLFTSWFWYFFDPSTHPHNYGNQGCVACLPPVDACCCCRQAWSWSSRFMMMVMMTTTTKMGTHQDKGRDLCRVWGRQWRVDEEDELWLKMKRTVQQYEDDKWRWRWQVSSVDNGHHGRQRFLVKTTTTTKSLRAGYSGIIVPYALDGDACSDQVMLPTALVPSNKRRQRCRWEHNPEESPNTCFNCLQKGPN